MAYTLTEWKTGDVITAEKLNNIEAGIAQAGSVYLVKIMDAESHRYLDTNFRKIKNAIEYGSFIVFLVEMEGPDNTRIFNYMTADAIGILPTGGGVISLDGTGFVAQNDNDCPTEDGSK